MTLTPAEHVAPSPVTTAPPEDLGSATDSESPTPLCQELLYDAWVVIANVSEGDWTKQPQEWQDAAMRWRDRWHETLHTGAEGPPALERTE